MRISWGRIAMLALVLPALSAMQSPQQAPPPAGISAEYFSWGRLTASWAIAPNGDGEVREMEFVHGFGDDYDVRIKRFHVGPEGFARLRQLMEPVRRFVAAGSEYDCRQYVTDGPYGSLRWNVDGATGLFPLQFGCMSDQARRLFGHVGQMADVVAEWARPAPVAEVRQIRRGAGAGIVR
jgi:hypothetical protein